MGCDVCEREIEPGDAMICVGCMEEMRGLAHERIAALKAELATVIAANKGLRGKLMQADDEIDQLRREHAEHQREAARGTLRR